MCEVCERYDKIVSTLKESLIDRSVLTDEFIQELIDRIESDYDSFLDGKYESD